MRKDGCQDGRNRGLETIDTARVSIMGASQDDEKSLLFDTRASVVPGMTLELVREFRRRTRQASGLIHRRT